MQIDVIPALIDQYRETFEREVRPGVCWIVDDRPDAGLLGTLAPLSAEQAFAPPTPGAKSIAAHVAHLRFTLDLNLKRLHGENPPADWPASFAVPGGGSPAAWDAQRHDLRRAYEGVLAFLEPGRAVPPQDWPPIHLVGLSAIIAHNAYHLGAIRQMARVASSGQALTSGPPTSALDAGRRGERVTSDAPTGETSANREPDGTLSSRMLAVLIIDALMDAGIVRRDSFETAVGIAEEEVEVRKAGGDY